MGLFALTTSIAKFFAVQRGSQCFPSTLLGNLPLVSLNSWSNQSTCAKTHASHTLESMQTSRIALTRAPEQKSHVAYRGIYLSKGEPNVQQLSSKFYLLAQ